MSTLEGHIGLVTGGAQGIGAGIARRLAADGAAVVLADLDVEQAQVTAGAIEAAGGRAAVVHADVTSQESMDAAVAAAVERFGDLTLMVNNAGLNAMGLIHRVQDADWRLAQDVILDGALHGLRAVAPHFRVMDAPLPRRVVNIASIAGIYGGFGAGAYAAAKGGVIALTRTAALEWARYGVTVNAVAPGFIDTRLTAQRDETARDRGMDPAVRDKIVGRIPLGRAGRPEDVAAAVAYFCAPDAGFVTGQVLEVHGGLADLNAIAAGH
jgi:NAD(P)-dependent dehydrogenase (short-subunit alcohol dehydrogenase family)